METNSHFRGLRQLSFLDLDEVQVRRQVDEEDRHHALAFDVDDVAKAAAQVLKHQRLGRLLRHLFCRISNVMYRIYNNGH